MLNSVKSIALAATLVVGAFSASSTAANAGSVNFDAHTAGFSIHIGNGERRYRGHRRHRGYGYNDGWERPRHRTCSPRKALRKAKRKGLRRAHIVRVGKRGVIVKGRKWGDRVTMGFGKHRSCPVRFVRAR